MNEGLTALVGENDSGKSAVVDAIRFALGTTDQDWYRLEETDFHQNDTKLEIKIICKFIDLSNGEKPSLPAKLTPAQMLWRRIEAAGVMNSAILIRFE